VLKSSTDTFYHRLGCARFRKKIFSLISKIKRIWIRFTCVSLFHYKISLLFFGFFSLIFASNFLLCFTLVIFASKRNKAKRNSSLFFRFFHFFRYFSHFLFFFSFFSLFFAFFRFKCFASLRFSNFCFEAKKKRSEIQVYFFAFFTFFRFFSLYFHFFSLNFCFASIFSLNFRLFYLCFRFRFLVFASK
jgi:hypothetical protein